MSSRTRISKPKGSRVRQGDIIKNVVFIECVTETKDLIEIKKLIFPYSIVLTQDCDLSQDSPYRDVEKESLDQKFRDKELISVLLAPLYNLEHIRTGQHLTGIERKATTIVLHDKKNKLNTLGTKIFDNEIPRYHYLEWASECEIPTSLIDFKHYYAVSMEYLHDYRKDNVVCSLNALFREQVSNRFAFYIGRIGLPDVRLAKS